MASVERVAKAAAVGPCRTAVEGPPQADVGGDLNGVLVADRELWQEGPPLALFARMRGECPVHWTARMSEFPEQAGFWSVTTAEDIHTVSRDWSTYSSQLGGVTATNIVFPLELTRAMLISPMPRPTPATAASDSPIKSGHLADVFGSAAR
jgi:hypothetical protein